MTDHETDLAGPARRCPRSALADDIHSDCFWRQTDRA